MIIISLFVFIKCWLANIVLAVGREIMGTRVFRHDVAISFNRSPQCETTSVTDCEQTIGRPFFGTFRYDLRSRVFNKPIKTWQCLASFSVLVLLARRRFCVCCTMEHQVYASILSQSPLIGACNSHKKPMKRHFLQTSPASSPVVPASFNVTSPVKLVGRTRLGRLAINGKSKMAEPGEESNFSRKNTAVTFRFYHLQWSLNVWKGCM